MFKLSLAGIALTLCAGAAAAQQPPAKPKSISLADVAGKWDIRATDLDGRNMVEVVLTATADGSDWLLVGANRPPIRERIVAVAGDSIVGEAGPYESFLLKGVQVRQRDVYRLKDGKLVGMLYGTYVLPRGDSTTVRRLEGTRVQADASNQ
jgi:hypothetical protein